MQKILIVDDEEKIRRIYRSLLAIERYEVMDARDGNIATDCLAKDPNINLVLLDINMPQLNGVALYEIIRHNHPRVKVIVTSAYPLEDQKVLILRAEDYYDKSQGTDILLQKVKRALGEPKIGEMP